jgi:hypothetical protein
MHMTLAVLKPDSVFAPVLAVADYFKFLLESRVIRVGYSETSILRVAMWRI